MDLPLTYPKAKGGTMVMWHISLSPHLKVLPSTSPCFISILLSPPGILPSLHTAVYLPTAGRDGEWLDALTELEQHVQGTIDQYGPLGVFLRGDFNASSKNKRRSAMLLAFITNLELSKVTINHLTYHHFTGSGDSDSDLDLLLYGGPDANEALVDVVCELQDPLMSSHHDMLISSCSIPPKQVMNHDKSKNIEAPRVPNLRFSTKWSKDGEDDYRQTVTPLLLQIRET